MTSLTTMPDAVRTCVAYAPGFRIRCGESAVATASLSGKSGPVCAADAERAEADGWTVTWDEGRRT